MALTLLQVVQKYMDRTSGFPISSINDLDESMQVASVAEDIFQEFVQLYPNLLFMQKDRTLDSVGDVDKPNFLAIPPEIRDIKESVLYYNVSKGVNETVEYRALRYETPLTFLQLTEAYRDSDNDTQVVEGFDGTKMVVINDQGPSFFTSFDGKYIVTDSYDSEVEATLQSSKTRMVSTEIPNWVMDDNFVIPIPEHTTSAYLNMVLDQAYNDVRQERNGLISQKARRDRIKLQQDSNNVGSAERAKQRYGRQSNIRTYGRTNRTSNT